MSDFETINPLTLSEVTTGTNIVVAFNSTTGEPKKITLTDNTETRIDTLESGKMAKITPADGYLLQSDENGQAKSSGIQSDNINGRGVSTDGAAYANYFKIIEVAMPTNGQAIDIKGSFLIKIEGSTVPRNLDFWLSAERAGSENSFRTVVLKTFLPYGLNITLFLRATVDNTNEKLYLFIKKNGQFNYIRMYIQNIFRSFSPTVTFLNTDTGSATAPTGDSTTTEPTATYWEATPTSNSIIIDEAWTTYTPVVTAVAGSITTYTATARYKRIGRTVVGIASITVTTNGTGSSGIIMTLPVVPRAALATDDSIGHGHITVSAQKSVNVKLYSDGGTLKAMVRDYAGAYPVISGDKIHVSFQYESAS